MHKKSSLVFAAFAYVALTGCSAVTEPESEAGEASAALGELGSPPPATSRRLVRRASSGCPTVYGDGGTWSGDVVAGPSQSSAVFCAYAWTSPTKADADLAKLDEIAMYDNYLAKPFNVYDPRSTNEDAVTVAMTKYTPLTTEFPISNGGDPTPRSSGCDVCVSPNGPYLWFVLPPEAIGHVVYAKAKAKTGTLYSLGKVTEVAMFALTPDVLDGEALILTWQPTP